MNSFSFWAAFDFTEFLVKSVHIFFNWFHVKRSCSRFLLGSGFNLQLISRKKGKYYKLKPLFFFCRAWFWDAKCDFYYATMKMHWQTLWQSWRIWHQAIQSIAKVWHWKEMLCFKWENLNMHLSSIIEEISMLKSIKSNLH